MANDLVLNGSSPFAGLGTQSYTIPITGAYEVSVQTTLPPNSGVQIAIKLNGSSQVTVGGAASNPTTTQPSIGAQARIQCTAADVVAVVLSSSSSVDTMANALKSNITLFQTV